MMFIVELLGQMIYLCNLFSCINTAIWMHYMDAN